MAREIQSRLTPSGGLSVPGMEIAVRYRPAMWVGGDYCDVWLLPDRRVAFAVGDVSGKGLPAAMVMSNLQAALRTTTRFCQGPAEAIGEVNAHLAQHLPMGRFVTLFLAFCEVAEETGLAIDLLGVAGAAQFEAPDRVVAYLVLEGKASGEQVVLSGEHEAFQWVSRDRLAEVDVVPQFRGVLRKCLSG